MIGAIWLQISLIPRPKCRLIPRPSIWHLGLGMRLLYSTKISRDNIFDIAMDFKVTYEGCPQESGAIHFEAS